MRAERVRARMPFLFLLLSGVVLDARGADQLIAREIAEAQMSRVSVAGEPVVRRDFMFSNGKAQLRKDGSWTIETVIAHGGLRCGNYKISIRFGAGGPGCLNVAWLTEFPATNLKHCNNAERLHVGRGNAPELSEAFASVTCAERTTRCSGVCSARAVGRPEFAPKSFGE